MKSKGSTRCGSLRSRIAKSGEMTLVLKTAGSSRKSQVRLLLTFASADQAPDPVPKLATLHHLYGRSMGPSSADETENMRLVGKDV